MTEPSLLHQQIELLSANFKPAEINEIGKLIIKGYDSHIATGTNSHITLSSRKCASALVEACREHDCTDKLIQMLAELDEKTLLGRPIKVEGIEALLNDLSKAGMVYDFQRKRILHARRDIHALVNWGSLKDGKEYSVSVMSLDIVNNSGLVKTYGTRAMEKLYYKLRLYIQSKIESCDGRVWSFAGDGGIVAFTFKDHETRALLCGLEILRSLPLFNMTSVLPLSEKFTLRLGLHSGKLRFMSDTGSIVSDVINYAAHLEKKAAEEGKLAISSTIKEAVDPRIMTIFEPKGVFEDLDYYQTVNRLDLI